MSGDLNSRIANMEIQIRNLRDKNTSQYSSLLAKQLKSPCVSIRNFSYRIYKQSYPQRMRLQKRFYGTNLIISWKSLKIFHKKNIFRTGNFFQSYDRYFKRVIKVSSFLGNPVRHYKDRQRSSLLDPPDCWLGAEWNGNLGIPFRRLFRFFFIYE